MIPSPEYLATMNNKRILIAAVAVLCTCCGLRAQTEGLGLWTSAEVKKKIFPGFELFAEGDFRLRENLKVVNRWSLGAGASYRVFPFLKAEAGYNYIQFNHPAGTTNKGNYIPEYWSPRHRANLSLTGHHNLGRFKLSLRERYQYTHRVGLSVPKYSSEEMTKQKDDEEISSKSTHVLRSRLLLEYNIRKSGFSPYGSAELYNSLDKGGALKKIRWTLGTQYKLNKKNAFDFYYLYQDESDEDEANGHILGVGYSFKF